MSLSDNVFVERRENMVAISMRETAGARWHGKTLTPQEARDLAAELLEAAVAAEERKP